MNETQERKPMKQYQTDDIKELAAALAKAQGSITHAGKGVKNEFFKSKYADLPAVIDAAKKPLADNGLSVVQFTDTAEDGKVILITQLTHNSGQWMRGYYPVQPIKNDPQGFGSALTYARRYAFCAITGVAAIDEDDDGNAASDRSVKPETAASKKKRFAEVKKAIEESNDPAITWHEHQEAIIGFRAEDPTFYDDLVAAGAKRKKDLEMIAATTAGMPQGFNEMEKH